MRGRALDWTLALTLAAALTWLVLVPAPPRPQDLELQVISVRPIPPQDGYPRQVAVRLRWRWLRPPGQAAASRSWVLIVIGADPMRWRPRMEGGWFAAEPRLLNLLGEPSAYSGLRVTPGEDGEATILLWSDGPERAGGSRALPLRVHYLHRAPSDWSGPHSSWVKTVQDIYPLPPPDSD